MLSRALWPLLRLRSRVRWQLATASPRQSHSTSRNSRHVYWMIRQVDWYKVTLTEPNLIRVSNIISAVTTHTKQKKMLYGVRIRMALIKCLQNLSINCTFHFFFFNTIVWPVYMCVLCTKLIASFFSFINSRPSYVLTIPHAHVCTELCLLWGPLSSPSTLWAAHCPSGLSLLQC